MLVNMDNITSLEQEVIRAAVAWKEAEAGSRDEDSSVTNLFRAVHNLQIAQRDLPRALLQETLDLTLGGYSERMLAELGSKIQRYLNSTQEPAQEATAHANPQGSDHQGSRA